MAQGILVVVDGVGDLPCIELQGKTPLEVADMKNLGFFSARGQIGYMFGIKPGYTPTQTESLLSMFGNNPDEIKESRLISRGMFVKTKKGDLVLKFNFCTIKAGEIYEEKTKTLSSIEAEELISELKEIEMPCKFDIKLSSHQEGIIIFRGNFSDEISSNKTSYIKGKKKEITNTVKIVPTDKTKAAATTAQLMNEFLSKAHEVLVKHSVNFERIQKGLVPANYILIESPSIEQGKLKNHKKWMSITSSPAETGFSLSSNMKTLSFSYPKQKTMDAYQNIHDGIKKICKVSIKSIKKNCNNYEYIYIHIKGTSFPGYDNKPTERKLMLETIDKTLFKFLRKFCPQRGIGVCVTSNVSIPCKLKSNSEKPVPVLLYNGQIPRENHFSEFTSRTGKLGKILGNDFLNKIGFC